MIDLLTENEAATFLGCSKRHLQHLRLNRRIAFIPGRPVVLERGDLEEFIEDRRFAGRVVAAPRAYGPPTLEAITNAAVRHATMSWFKRFPGNGHAAKAAQLRSFALREKSGVWFLHWLEGIRGRRISTRQRARAGAEAFLAEWTARVGKVRADERRKSTCTELWAHYVLKHEVVAPSRHRVAWAKLEPRFGALRPLEVTRELIREHLADRLPTKPSTVFVELSLLMASWRFALKRRLIKEEDFPTRQMLDLPKAPPPRERWLRKDEVQRLFDAAREMRRGSRLSRLERFMHVALKTGARRTAILELTWEQVDFETRVIHFNPEGRQQTKKRRASVPMTDGLVDVLIRAHAEHVGPLVLDHSTRMPDALKTAGERAGVAGVTHNVFRHTTATWLARGGMPLWKISKILGNTLEHVERSYAKHNLDDLREGVKLLDD